MHDRTPLTTPRREYVDHLERCCLMALRELNDAREADPARLDDHLVTGVRAWMCMAADAIEAEAKDGR